MFGFFVLWILIGIVIVGYDVLNDIRLGVNWRLLLPWLHIFALLVIFWPVYLGVRK